MQRNTVRINIKPWSEIVTLARKIAGRRVRVGLFDGRLALIGLVHEYGSKTVPQRSWLRSTFAIRRADIAAFQTRIMRLMIARKIDEQRALELLGAYVVSLIKEQIVQFGPLIFVPLKPATIAAKGGKTAPLINTGQLLNAITFVVV